MNSFDSTGEEHLVMVAGPISEDIQAKLARVRDTEQPLRVVDLFSGCGGMSLGLQRAGFQILGGIEMNPLASATYATNLFRGASKEDFTLHATPHDITTYSPEEFLREVLQSDDPDGLVDVIAGGPPCQAFSRIGRAKLRHIHNHPEAYRTDERSSLYLRYLLYVDFFRPLVVLMENVPDIMNYGGENIAENIANELEELGYHCRYTILNTVHYGVPQFRQRFYLLAFREELLIEPSFPAPTHILEQMPTGYESARNVALKTIQFTLNAVHHYQHPPVIFGPDLLPVVSTRQAMGDLPILRSHQRVKPRGGKRAFDTQLPYLDVEPSTYAQDMRTWSGYEASDGVVDHVIRYLPRDYPIFRMMKYNDQYPQAHKIAEGLLERRVQKYERKHGLPLDKASEEYQRLRKETVPPYDPGKFPNKWWKLHPDHPSRTLTAHMGKDTYSHIHYDYHQGRVISVREAARLQSFPDGFIFACSMNAAYTMIGNAVAPHQACVLGEHVLMLLREFVEKRAYLSESIQSTPTDDLLIVPAGSGEENA